MKTVLKFTVAMFLFIGCVTYVSAQGFVNLNFELAGLFIAPTSPGSYGGQVDPALAFPGWTIRNTRFTNFGTYILYNNLTVDSAMVGLIGPSYPNALNLTSLHGSYSALLQEASIGSYFGRPTLEPVMHFAQAGV